MFFVFCLCIVLLVVVFSIVLGMFVFIFVFVVRFVVLVKVDILYEQFILFNGLCVIVYIDCKVLIVVVNVWYYVGSKDELVGCIGFVYLFEYLMFQGSENYDGEFFELFKQVGVINQNGIINIDCINYFENVLIIVLDMVLWMELDCMGYLVGVIDQVVFDEQCGVVQNEKCQGENQFYGQVWDQFNKVLYLVGYLYYYGVIGLMNDLNVVLLDDVKIWFCIWYGLNNVVLVLVGDIDLVIVKEKVVKYFGSILVGLIMVQLVVNVVKCSVDMCEMMIDKVLQVCIYCVWNVLQVGIIEVDQLQLFVQVLGGVKFLCLSQCLQYQDKLVDSIVLGLLILQLGLNFVIMVMVKQGQDLVKVEKIIDEELDWLIKQGLIVVELECVKIGVCVGFIRGIECIGGFGGKVDVLVECVVFIGDLGCFCILLVNIEKVSVVDLSWLGVQWLDKGSYILVIVLGECVVLKEDLSQVLKLFIVLVVDLKYSILFEQVDCKVGVFQICEFLQLKFLVLQCVMLKNGIEVILVECYEILVVQFSYQFLGGFSVDQGCKLGIVNFIMSLMIEGVGKLGLLVFVDVVDVLGVSLDVLVGLDLMSVDLLVLKENLVLLLVLYCDLLCELCFEQGEIDWVKVSWIVGIQQEKVNLGVVVMCVLFLLLYGKGYLYVILFIGSGDEVVINGLICEDLVDFYQDWLCLQNGILIVVGDIILVEIVLLLDKQLGDWKVSGEVLQVKVVIDVVLLKGLCVFLIDQLGVVQVNLFVGQVVVFFSVISLICFDIVNGVIGGDFILCLNMNLCEDKYWLYGVCSSVVNLVGQCLWMVSVLVQIDKIGLVLVEMCKEIVVFVDGSKLVIVVEVNCICNIQILSLFGVYEIVSVVVLIIGLIVQFKCLDDYVLWCKVEIEVMILVQVQQVVVEIKLQVLIWVVVGDFKQIEVVVCVLNLGEVMVIDVEGNLVKK